MYLNWHGNTRKEQTTKQDKTKLKKAYQTSEDNIHKRGERKKPH